MIFYDPDEWEYIIYSDLLHPVDYNGMKKKSKLFSMKNDVCSME